MKQYLKIMISTSLCCCFVALVAIVLFPIVEGKKQQQQQQQHDSNDLSSSSSSCVAQGHDEQSEKVRFKDLAPGISKFTHLDNDNIFDDPNNYDDDDDVHDKKDSKITISKETAEEMGVLQLMRPFQSRLKKMFKKTKTPQCRTKIINHFNDYLSAIANEKPLPFSQTWFNNECTEEVIKDFDNLPDGVSVMSLMEREYRPLRNESLYIDNDNDLILLYGILTHGKNGASSTIRLIEALDGSNNSNGSYNSDGKTLFVIHVDGKEESDETFDTLVEYSMKKSHVHVVPTEFRIRANWGGFTIVNATMQILKYAFALLPQSSTSTKLLDEELRFHKFVHIASSTYPIRSNTEIRKTLGSFPLDANLFYVGMIPINQHPAAWHSFVECDDALHRVYRLHPLSLEMNDVRQYMGSQWFISSHEFAKYLAEAEEGSFVQQYINYAKHIIVADEGFFATVLRHSRFCEKHHNSNMLHLYFDRWESDLENIDRDERKCLMPDPNKCGRSPTILTKDYLFAFELSDALFARKFTDDEVSEMKDILDIKRSQEEAKYRDIAAGNYTKIPRTVSTSFAGLGTLIVAKETIHDHHPLCLGLGNSGHKVKLVPCFHNEVINTLANDWATGAVIEEEVLRNNRWEIGPCSSDGSLRRDPDTAEMIMESGSFSPAGPRCMIKQLGGKRNGRCLDIFGERVEPGGELEVYPCIKQWNQMFGFGDGIVSRNATIFAKVPDHIVNALKYKGKSQEPNLCFGVVGRSSKKYVPWKEDDDKERFNTVDFLPKEAKPISLNKDRLKSLRLWKFKHLVTVPCSDKDAALDFVFVPFIEEDSDTSEANIDTISSIDESSETVFQSTIDEL